MPINTQIIFVKDILSAIPINPMEVVVINTSGPIKASELFTTKAFSTLFSFKIINATNISNVPEIIRKRAIPKIAFSNM